MSKTLILLILFSIISICCRSQDEMTDFRRKPHAIGLTANSFSGIGLTYNFFPEKVGFQFNGLLMMQHSELFSMTGASFMVSLKRNQRTNVFLHFSNSLYYEQYDDSQTGRDGYGSYNVGIGPGIELMGKDFSCSLMYGFGFYDNFNVFFTLGGGITFLVLL